MPPIPILARAFFMSFSPLRLSVSARDTILRHRSELAVQSRAVIPRGSHTKPQRHKEEQVHLLSAFLALWLRVRTSPSACHGSPSIRRLRRFPDNHQSPITNHQRQGPGPPTPAFGRSQERLSLCRAPAERGAIRCDPPAVPRVPHNASNAFFSFCPIPRLCLRTTHDSTRR
jgi:hypothetical protein